MGLFLLYNCLDITRRFGMYAAGDSFFYNNLINYFEKTKKITY